MRDTILTVSGLTMRFGGLTAVNAVSFEAKRGDITAVIVRECGAVELWREGQEGPPPEAA